MNKTAHRLQRGCVSLCRASVVADADLAAGHVITDRYLGAPSGSGELRDLI